ncbi:hypothetical protein HLB35_05140 [Halomonas sp. TBZ9]|uniref:Uncharacterized protein n=1 Tax=Vreelandella azerica TaxID=2732867 RepID=A0A7Y3XAF8_9GAMM|nr:hypothetical protein [Halomonas azerica]NOG31304.1 hypothetical protein [Halomonas azerica]
MKRAMTISFAMLALAGCQTSPDLRAPAESAPAKECHFAYDTKTKNVEQMMRQSVNVLDELGFTLRSADGSLGIISARRDRPLRDYDDGFDARGLLGGLSMFGGFGGGGSSTFGLGIGTRLGSERHGAAREVEDVTLVVDEASIRIARDIRRFDGRGSLREAYSASDASFCQQLQQALMR